MSESNEQHVEPTPVQSPPPMPTPAKEQPDPRADLFAMAQRLTQVNDKHLLASYLKLRRSIR